MKEKIFKKFQRSIEVKQDFIEKNINNIMAVSELLINTLKQGKKIFICGNGGSATDSLHFAGELVNRLQFDHPPLPVISLNADIATLTAIANDYGYSEIFAKPLEAYGKEDDAIILVSTSRNSENLINACYIAKELGIKTIALLGKTGGLLKDLVDIPLIVNDQFSGRIQETHITILHILAELIEDTLFGNDNEN